MRLDFVLSFISLLALGSSSPFLYNEDWPWPWPHRPRTTTIIDLLSTSADFTPLLKLLQRTALIPILNGSENLTLVAPIADAVDGFDGDVTRELMMYHILNGSVLSTTMTAEEVVVESILKMEGTDRGVGVKVKREGDRGRGQGKLRIGDVARVVKSDWEANNGMSEEGWRVI
jgi:uncharacterized surface protein with fasciclin (FAS1) repeats